ncbi:thiopeptide-type bacteriocin biosynthesis protein [Cryptosporangium sp. NPDC051539]|uniref:thiopeptide-type bacteriocin biosynthesis protein n=1 Tax=Cryptosporangium sp. NPDC051539 TaxID=3363962 RepID=UPI0037A82B20
MRDIDDLTIHPASPSPWHQINLRVPDELTGATGLQSVMGSAEADGLIDSWFFIRKGQWRVRFRPADLSVADHAHAAILGGLADLRRPNDLADPRGVSYEPETYVFGGRVGMDVTHQLWHADSRNVVAYLASLETTGKPDRRREISILLLSAMLQAASLDWYEQGDIWARVADEDRPLDKTLDSRFLVRLVEQIRRLMIAGPAISATAAESIASLASWLSDFVHTGRAFMRHAQQGELSRGLRRVLGHQFIFHWNRLGLTAKQQALICAAARSAVFPSDIGMHPFPAPYLDLSARSGATSG